MIEDGGTSQFEVLARESILFVGGTMRQEIEAQTSSISHFKEVQEAVRSLGCEFVWVKGFNVGGDRQRRVGRPPIQSSVSGRAPDGVVLLLRLSAGMVDTFGLSSEIPVLVSRHDDIQSRLIVRALDVLEGIEDRDFDSSRLYCFVSSSKFVQSINISDRRKASVGTIWGREKVEIRSNFVKFLVSKYRSPNRYDRVDPVVAGDFYGRERTLTDLKKGILAQEVQGVFGMRKTGKTSVLHELKTRYSAQSQREIPKGGSVTDPVYVYYDLEGYDFSAQGDVEHMAKDLAGEICRELAKCDISRKDIAEYAETEASQPLREFTTAITRTLGYRKNAELHIVVMLDEIEHFMPPSVDVNASGARIVQFLQVMRKLVQDSKNSHDGGKFSLVIAGLAPSIVEESLLYGKDNPLFRFVRSTFLGPLDAVESKELLVGIGSRMGMDWTGGACELAHQRTGGNVVLLRELGSGIAEDRDPYDLRVFRVDGARVEEASRKLPALAKGYLEQAMSHLEERYSDEYALINLVVEDGADLQVAASDVGIDLKRLVQLGLVVMHGSGQVERSRLLDLALAGRNSASTLSAYRRGMDRKTGVRDFVKECIQSGEGRGVEFKSTFMTPVNGRGEVVEGGVKSPDTQKKLIHSCFKSFAAFANTCGGSLIIGLGDDGSIIGIDRCLQTLGGEDKFLLKLSDEFRKRSLGGEVDHLYSVDIVHVDRSTLAVVQVVQGEVYSAGEDGNGQGRYVRGPANTRFLQGLDLVKYKRPDCG